MRLHALIPILAAGLFALSGVSFAADDAAQIPVNKGSTKAGDGQSVSFKGSALPLSGTGIKVGDHMPSVTITGAGLAPVNVSENKGRVRIINIVPSLDTPTCDAQTHELVEKDPALATNVDLVTISMDLPFAQARWARAAKAKNMTFLSDYKTGEFGTSTGL